MEKTSQLHQLTVLESPELAPRGRNRCLSGKMERNSTGKGKNSLYSGKASFVKALRQ